MGRVILNLWKLLKQYEKSVYDTLGGLVQKCLHITYPLYSLDTITEWWNAKHCQISFFPLRNLAIHYKLCYLKLCFKLFDTSDLFNRFSERSRFLGTDITSTIHRGSQYHVEGLIARAGTFLGYVMPTAAKIQVFI
jgi:DNA polymerase elongation subunit (family B)